MLDEQDAKVIKAKIEKDAGGKIVLRFSVGESTKDLELEVDDLNMIRSVFTWLLQYVIDCPISIGLEPNNEIEGEGKNGLFLEVVEEYVRQLNDELMRLEQNEDLRKIRESNNDEDNCDRDV